MFSTRKGTPEPRKASFHGMLCWGKRFKKSIIQDNWETLIYEYEEEYRMAYTFWTIALIAAIGIYGFKDEKGKRNEVKKLVVPSEIIV